MNITAHPIRLGLNIDHVATLRNARGGAHPNPLDAALLAEKCGVDSITVHLREDRRHIVDADVENIKQRLIIPLNLEMAATEEMQAIALATMPHACCLVPEKRAERTTEGGLDVVGQEIALTEYCKLLIKNGIRVSLFINPDAPSVQAASRIGAQVVELHTGGFCEGHAPLSALQDAAILADSLGLEVHAGHGLTYETTALLAKNISSLKEVNIGHFMIGEAVLHGLPAVIKKMKAALTIAKN